VNDHLASIFAKIAELETVVASLTSGKKVTLSDSVEMELPLSETRVNVSLSAAYKVAKYGTKINLGDQEIWATFELESYGRVWFVLECEPSVRYRIWMNGHEKKGKRFLVTRDRSRSSDLIVIQLDVELDVESWGPDKPRTVEPRMYTGKPVDNVSCTAISDPVTIPDFPS
jgi:hypothetical protein